MIFRITKTLVKFNISIKSDSTLCEFTCASLCNTLISECMYSNAVICEKKKNASAIVQSLKQKNAHLEEF